MTEFLVGATAYGISGSESEPQLVEFSRHDMAVTGGRREMTEIRPVGIDCFLPRSTANDKLSPAKGTARVLGVRYSSPTFDLVGQTMVSAVQLVQDDPPTEWTELLHHRGSIFAPTIPSGTQEVFLLDDGLEESSDLDLLGIAAHAGGSQGRKKSRTSASVRAVWSARQVHIALLRGGIVSAVRVVDIPSEADLLFAMSVAADFAFVSWLSNEVDVLVPRILRRKLPATQALREYLELDELFESHRCSNHAQESERFLATFGVERQWNRLARRIEMACSVQRWDL